MTLPRKSSSETEKQEKNSIMASVVKLTKEERLRIIAAAAALDSSEEAPEEISRLSVGLFFDEEKQEKFRLTAKEVELQAELRQLVRECPRMAGKADFCAAFILSDKRTRSDLLSEEVLVQAGTESKLADFLGITSPEGEKVRLMDLLALLVCERDEKLSLDNIYPSRRGSSVKPNYKIMENTFLDEDMSVFKKVTFGYRVPRRTGNLIEIYKKLLDA